jgi:hypothetical protein
VTKLLHGEYPVGVVVRVCGLFRLMMKGFHFGEIDNGLFTKDAAVHIGSPYSVILLLNMIAF